MKEKLQILMMAMLFSTAAICQTVNIIPQPVSVSVKTGSFQITKQTKLVAPGAAEKLAADFFNDYLQTYYGFKLAVSKTAAPKAISFSGAYKLDGAKKGAYQFTSSASGVTVRANSPEGVFYGMQTLIQLLPTEKGTTLAVQAVEVTDEPRFGYRGSMLDVARHFFPVSFVKKYIDYLALHKMNYFHWHLTDDQGWRVEVKKYPKLTTVGAFRHGSVIGRYPGTGTDNTPHGGFYTQAQMKEVVAYAAKRFITIIPEIEMPGHGSAAIAAYPWLSCFPEVPTIRYFPKESTWAGDSTGKQVQQSWGVYDDVFCAGKENTYKFLQDVLDEIVPIFPGKIVHVGGDECPKENWKKCPDCQKKIKENGLKDEHGLQSYLVQRMEKYLNGKGKTLVGWDEILEGGLAPNAVVMSWRGEEGGIAAAKQNHKVIMTPASHVYLDHAQTEQEDSVTIGGYLPIEKVYSYEPIPKELSEEQAKFVLGGQCNVWSEYFQYPSKVEYMVFPRLSALSEVLWSPKAVKNWDNFKAKTPAQFKRYELWGASYFKKN